LAPDSKAALRDNIRLSGHKERACVDDRAAIRAVLNAVNDAWQTYPAGDIAACIREHFAADAVIVGPDLARVGRGRDAIAQSYADFAGSATIRSVELEDPEIDVIADVAAATLKWRLRYEYAGAEFSEAGRDVYVFGRLRGRWLIAWRKLESRRLD
jgi:ketosteroid isomerase-like protein